MRKTWSRKKKPLEYKATEKGCFECTSHYKNPKGYPIMNINGRNQIVTRYIYEECFGFIPEGLVVRHKCDNPSCINPEHLEIGTHKDNAQDRKMRNRAASLKGMNNGRSKLNENQVLEIVQRCRKGEVPHRFHKEYGIGTTAIYDIMAGRMWSHITGIKGDKYAAI